jgi:hypothetical protein
MEERLDSFADDGNRQFPKVLDAQEYGARDESRDVT